MPLETGNVPVVEVIRTSKAPVARSNEARKSSGGGGEPPCGRLTYHTVVAAGQALSRCRLRTPSEVRVRSGDRLEGLVDQSHYLVAPLTQSHGRLPSPVEASTVTPWP
jgi:hypothetical protein